MKKSLFVFILLSGFIGCARSPSPITIQNEQNNGPTSEPASSRDAVVTETTAEYLSMVLGKSSLETIVEEPEVIEEPDETETSAETGTPMPINYISRKDGFRVLMPSAPTVMNLEATNSTHVRIYQTQVQEGLVVYNVFCHFFEKKILSNESIRSHLDSSLPDYLVGADKGQAVRKTLTKFRGFNAKEFEYISAEGDAEFIYKGVVFLIDGDSISLTMAHPKETKPEFTFDEFTESFELLPLEPILSPDHWVDKRLGLQFTPPAGMSNQNREKGHNGLIVMFANEVGHTIGILDATVAYQGITWSEIHKRLSQMKDCGDGFYENIISETVAKTPTVQLLRCVGNGDRIYLIQAYAPEKTYFRSVHTFKAAMKSLSFTN
jgi:hypothetical protein